MRHAKSLNQPIVPKPRRIAQIRGLRVNPLPSVPKMSLGRATMSLIWNKRIALMMSTNLDATGVLSLESQLMLLTFKPLTPRVPKEPKAKVQRAKVQRAKVQRAKAKAKSKGEVTKEKEKEKETLGQSRR